MTKSLTAIMVLAAAVSGCIEPGTQNVIVAQNASPERQNVEVFYLLDNQEEQLLVQIEPGSSPGLREAITGQCTQGSLVARYLDGEEVERRGPGVCVGTIWLINGDPSD